MHFPDIQNTPMNRQIDLVGIEDFVMPLKVLQRDSDDAQEVVATVKAGVRLVGQRGINMSRIPQVLLKYDLLAPDYLETVLPALCEAEEADESMLTVAFPFKRDFVAPVSGFRGPLYFPCGISGSLRLGEEIERWTTVQVQVISTCPCSKSLVISQGYGAPHMQRAFVWLSVKESEGLTYFEDLIDLVLEIAPRPYPVVKRSDEAEIAKRCWDLPFFVEDLASRIADAVDERFKVFEFEVRVRSEESIHHHDAFATIRRRR